MFDDEVTPQKPPKRNLEIMSVEALQEYIAELEGEIERVRAMIRQKQGLRGEAESLFRR